ncbi:MAG TPA: MsnO8 family LLM class oxidoreductase [Candidatus Acidoferrum sp.]
MESQPVTVPSQPTARALRRNIASTSDNFPQDVEELQAYFESAAPNQIIRAVPGAGLLVPIWVLGSSLFSAQLAAELGLPFAFASHFAPADMMQALQLYRTQFKPSRQLDHPYAMLGLNVIVAETGAQARCLFSSVQQAITNLRRGTPGQIPPPIDDIDSYWSPAEKASAGMTLLVSAVVSPETVERGVLKFIEVTQPDEIMTTAHIYDHSARLRSFELLAGIRARLASSESQHTAPIASSAGPA